MIYYGGSLEGEDEEGASEGLSKEERAEKFEECFNMFDDYQEQRAHDIIHQLKQ